MEPPDIALIRLVGSSPRVEISLDQAVKEQPLVNEPATAGVEQVIDAPLCVGSRFG
jgi:hypothetical protein